MHVLLVRFSSLGDIVMQTSFISWLKFINPKIEISFITSKGFESLLKNHEDLDRLYAYKKTKGLKDLINLRKFIKSIDREKKIDFIIDLHGTTRSSYLKLLNPSIPAISIDKRRIERHFLVHCGFKLMNKTPSIHSRNINDFMGLFNTNKSLSNYSSYLKEKYSLNNLKYSSPLFKRDTQKEKAIITAPVASFKNKRWNILNYKELILNILSQEKYKDYKLINLAGPDDNFCDELNFIKNDRFINLQGKTSLEETIGYISKASLVIGNDSGLGHIAECFGVNVISIFGPTHESLGFRPHLDNSTSISHNIWCRPCSPTGKSRCYRSKQYCMENIKVSEVMGIFQARFNNDL